MRLNRGLLFWGLGLVTAGIVALAITQGYVDRAILGDMWRLWPLILVAIGIAVVTARTPFAVPGTAVAAIVIGALVGAGVALGPGMAISCGSDNVPGTTTSRGGSLGATATLDWQLNCAHVEVATVTGTESWTLRFGSDPSSEPQVDASGNHLRLGSPNDSGFLQSSRERWIVALPAATTYDADIHANGGSLTMNVQGSTFHSLSLQPNAVDVRLDATDANVSGLNVHLNAGKLVVVVTAGSAVEGQIEANAGSVSLCARPDAAVRITASGTAFSTNLDGSGLQRSGDTWESASYASADRTITLEIHGNASSFDLNPEGC